MSRTNQWRVYRARVREIKRGAPAITYFRICCQIAQSIDNGAYKVCLCVISAYAALA